MHEEELNDRIPKDKYIILVDYQGKFQGKAAFRLRNRGYKVLQTYGGILSLSDVFPSVKYYSLLQ
jgi:hypothetical protein